MTDIVEFLRARMDEQHQAADRLEQAGDWPTLFGGIEQFGAAPSDAAFSKAGDLFSAQRLLADVEANRRIIEEHMPKRVSVYKEPDEWNCRRCGKADEYPVEHPCTTLRLLAQPYSGHPDFREEWKIDG